MTDRVPYIEACPLGCNAGLVDTDIVLPEGALRRCTVCGQLLSRCSEEWYGRSMAEFADPRGTWPTGSSARRLLQQAGRILTRLEGLTGKARQSMRLLDVGCSSGAFVDAVNRLGGVAEGVEPAAEPVATARAAGLTVHQGFLVDLGLPAASFDALTLFEVIEHLREPISLLRECYRLLRPGGCLVLRTGNTASWTVRYMKSRWLYFSIARHGGHVSFFNPGSMRLLAERTGFAVAVLSTHSVGFYEKGDIPAPFYRLAKIFAEACNAPAKIMGRGHEMVVYLRKPGLGEERG